MHIAVPSYSGDITAFTALSLIMATAALSEVGIKWSVAIQPGVPYLDHARNMLVTKFLENTEATDLLFIDADVAFAPQSAVMIAQATRPFIAGIYPKKMDEPKWPVAFDADRLWSDEDGNLEASMVPTGFLRLNRSVFDAMPSEEYCDDNGDRWIKHFRCGAWGGKYNGEDPDFCARWRGIGGKIHIIPNLTFSHTGKKSWEGNWAKWIMDQQKEVTRG
ncbi:MAG: hypothetical protein ACREDY_00895 [Bradyrhizobium sp.]